MPQATVFRAVLLGAILVGMGCHGGEVTYPEGATCVEERDCEQELTCAFGRCRRPCVTDETCSPGICLPAASDSDAAARLCSLPAEAACGTDKECPAPLSCAADGHCRAPCDDARPCPAGASCAEGHCFFSTTCGDGVRQGSEACDDGNDSPYDDCLPSCVPARCGDGVVWQGHEACDDGNSDDGDECLSTCRWARCGDGVVQRGREQCDDGNEDNHDGCLNSCLLARCGDSVLWIGLEACDDGNQINSDECPNNCHAPRCGNGLVDVGETCDEGTANVPPSAVPTRACRQVSCTRCGDGVVQPEHDESCDDGNRSNDDLCLSDCTLRFQAQESFRPIPVSETWSLNSLSRTDDGLLLLAFLDDTGSVWVVQSADEGLTWEELELGQPEGRPLTEARLFGLDSDRMALTARTEEAPFQSFLQLWPVASSAAPDAWLPLSGPLGPEAERPAHGVVTPLPDGRYLAFFDGGWHWTSPTLTEFAELNARGFAEVLSPPRWFPLVETTDSSVFVILFGEGSFDFYTSRELEVPTFARRANPALRFPVDQGDLWYDEAQGVFVCGASAGGETPATLGAVSLWHLAAQGESSWRVDHSPAPYLRGLAVTPGSAVACHFGPLGVTAAFRDRETGDIRLFLPAIPPS